MLDLAVNCGAAATQTRKERAMNQITKNNGTGLGLKRTTIATSRLMDFCSEKELVAQTGHQKAAYQPYMDGRDKD